MANFVFNTTTASQIIHENQWNKKSWFVPVLFGTFGITGLILIYFTDQAFRKVRIIRTLHLLSQIFDGLEDQVNYHFFLSVKGLFHTDADKKELDTWLVLAETKHASKTITLTDHSWIKTKKTVSSGKSNYASHQRVFSFMLVFDTNEKQAQDFIENLYALPKKSPHPSFPEQKLQEEIFIIDPNKFRYFDLVKSKEIIASL